MPARKPRWPQIPLALASSSYFGRRCLWTLASLFALLWLASYLKSKHSGPYSVWGTQDLLSTELIKKLIRPAPGSPHASVSVWLPSTLTKCYLSYLYASIDTFLCISGNNLLCSMIFYPSLIIQHTTGTDRFFKTQKMYFLYLYSALSECVWARISARYVSLSALSANFLPSVWCLMSRSQPVPVSSLSQYIHSMLLRHNSDLFMTSISCAQSRSHASIFQCRLSQNWY